MHGLELKIKQHFQVLQKDVVGSTDVVVSGKVSKTTAKERVPLSFKLYAPSAHSVVNGSNWLFIGYWVRLDIIKNTRIKLLMLASLTNNVKKIIRKIINKVGAPRDHQGVILGLVIILP